MLNMCFKNAKNINYTHTCREKKTADTSPLQAEHTRVL